MLSEFVDWQMYRVHSGLLIFMLYLHILIQYVCAIAVVPKLFNAKDPPNSYVLDPIWKYFVPWIPNIPKHFIYLYYVFLFVF